MNRRLTIVLAFSCAVFLQAATMPVAAQTAVAPVAPVAPSQTVKAAIPPQAPTAKAPAVVSVPSPARPATAPAPAAATQPATMVAPVAAAAPQAVTTPAPPQARPTPAPAPKPVSETEAANVKIEVAITYQVGNGTPVKRMATLTVADQGRGSLRAGNQVAVPSTTFLPVAAGGPGTNPMTSVNYKSVGLNVDANRVYIQGNKTRMELNVEFSAVDEKMTDAAGSKFPSFPTFSQSLTLVLESGKPLIVGQSSDVVDNVERRQTVEVKATILR